MKSILTLLQARTNEACQINSWLDLSVSPSIKDFEFDFERQLQENISISSEREVLIEKIKKDENIQNEIVEVNRLFGVTSDRDDDLPF